MTFSYWICIMIMYKYFRRIYQFYLLYLNQRNTNYELIYQANLYSFIPYFTTTMKNNNLLTCKVNQFYNKNQFVIFSKDNDNDFITFQSYESIICIIDYKNKTIQFWIDYDYSKTTWKHLNLFLKEYFTYDNRNRKLINKIIKDWHYNNYKIIYNEELR